MLRLESLELKPLFHQPGGLAFASFANEVLDAMCWHLGIPPSEISVCSRTDIPDGCVDTRIAKGATQDKSGYLQTPSVWQFKAVSGGSVGVATIRRELRKPRKKKTTALYVRECIERGEAYRFCVADMLTPEKKEKLLKAAEAEVRAIKSDAPPPLILSLDDFRGLANAFPALVLRYKPTLAPYILLFDAWEANTRAVTRTFVPGDNFEATRAALMAYCDFSKIPEEAVLPIQGAAGVGKTRTVYECMKSLPAARNTVLYTDDEERAAELSIILANDSRARAILVGDECSLSFRAQIANALRGHTDRVRCICIESSTDHLSMQAPELTLDKLPETAVERILEANFHNVSADRRRAYSALSEGFIRLAADMCRFDPQIVSAGGIGPALRTPQEYYHLRLNQQQRVAVQTIALLRRVKHKGESGNTELELLCKITNQNPQDIIPKLNAIKDAPGFIERGALYYRVTPHIIAIIAFGEAWRDWGEANSDDFLSQIPPVLQDAFLQRVSESASPEVRETVRRFFRQFAEELRPADLADLKMVNRLVQLVETDPPTYLPLLRRIVESASHEDLTTGREWEHGSWGPRRQLVWLSERLAQFPECFADAEAVLFVLAKNENEPRIGNNATKVWKLLFRMQLSGTSLPMTTRLETLEKRLMTAGPTDAELIIGALATVLDFQGTRILGPPVIAGRIPPTEWRPKTQDEFKSSVDAALNLVKHAMSHTVPSIVTGARGVLLSYVDALTRIGWIKDLRRMFPTNELEESVRAKMAKNLKFFLRLRRVPDGTKYKDDYITGLQQWVDELEPASPMGKLQEVVGSNSWEHYQHEQEWEDEMKGLARLIMADEQLFHSALDWLTSVEAKGAADFGTVVGAHDVSAIHLAEIIERSRSREIGFARGYVNGLVYRAKIDPTVLNQLLDNLEQESPTYAFYLALAGGKPVRVFERGLRLVEAGKIGPFQLRNFTHWVGNERTSSSECIRAVKLLLPKAQAGDSEAADTIIDLLAAQLNRETIGGFLESYVDVLSEVLATIKPEREAFWWHRLAAKLSDLKPELVIRAAANAMVGDNFELADQAKDLVATLAQKYPDLVMSEIGKLALSEDSGWRFLAGKYPVFTALPPEVVMDWIRVSGVSAARKVARHVPKPFLNADGRPGLHPLTEFLLTEFESDDETFTEFCVGVHNLQTYVGDLASAREREAQIARAFLNHPLRRAREWARYEEQSAEREARLHREMTDEMET